MLILPSCSSSGKKWDPEDYTVKSGDTIYSIAWRYELDADDFADWNGISPAHFIKPGQRLHTRKPANFDANKEKRRHQAIAYAPASTAQQVKPVNNTARPKWVKVRKGDSLYGLSREYGVTVERLAQLNQLHKPYVIKPGQTIFLKPLNSGKPSTRTAASSKQTPVTRSGTNNVSAKPSASIAQSVSWPKSVRWQRPAKGKIIKKFDRRRIDAKGIGIAGAKGNAIVASADGKVVYSGDGLISYGNLIIIKHNKTFLSAYAYNRKLLVKEGEMVKAGQQIAEMGNKDKSTTMLHFEIRKNGKPVDPLKYLPW